MSAAALAQLRKMSLEGLLRSKHHGFGLDTATPVQRAICRVIEGRPLGKLWGPDLEAGMGVPPKQRAREVVLLSGIRVAKSLIAALLAIHASQHCDLSQLRQSEVARVSVVSLTLDLATVVYQHIIGHLLRSDIMRQLLVQAPKRQSVLLRHPSGRIVEIKVVAGARAGASIAARWSAGAIFDEAPRMLGAEDGVVNLDDARDNAIGRLLPGAQIIDIGSPWAPYGPIYNLVQEHWKRPNERVCVMWFPAPLLNPFWWTPERCAALEKHDPDAYVTDVLAQFRSLESEMFDDVSLQGCTRESPAELAPEERAHYVACIDPATRGNAWTLVVATRQGGRKRIVLARQWQGSPMDPLKPSAVFGEMATILRPYRVSDVGSDEWSADALREHAGNVGLRLVTSSWTEKEAASRYKRAQTDLQHRLIELPPHGQLRDDLKRVKRRTTSQGFGIHLPKTGDGRHCDYAPPFVRCVTQWLADSDPVAETIEQRQERELREYEEQITQEVRREKSGRMR